MSYKEEFYKTCELIRASEMVAYINPENNHVEITKRSHVHINKKTIRAWDEGGTYDKFGFPYDEFEYAEIFEITQELIDNLKKELMREL